MKQRVQTYYCACNIPGGKGTWRLVVGTLHVERDLEVSRIPVWKSITKWFLKNNVKAKIKGLRDQEIRSSEAHLHRWIEQHRKQSFKSVRRRKSVRESVVRKVSTGEKYLLCQGRAGEELKRKLKVANRQGSQMWHSFIIGWLINCGKWWNYPW